MKPSLEERGELLSHQRAALYAMKFMVKAVVACAIVAWLAWAVSGCSRHDVGDETVNPAPSSSLTLAQAQAQGVAWALADPANHAWSTPGATSSMVPYLDSHSVALLEKPIGAPHIHDIVRVNEGPGRENVLHQVMDVKTGYVFIDGKNNQWADGWMPVGKIDWRVVAIFYSKG